MLKACDSRNSLPGLIVITLGCMLATPSWAEIFFQGIGDLEGGSSWSEALAISSDGTTVVGSGITTNSAGWDVTAPFRWTRNGGIIDMGDLSGGVEFLPWGEALAVSADGSVIVGMSSVTGDQAFRWTEAEGMIALGGGYAYGVSGDGSVVVGKLFLPDSEKVAFRWQVGDDGEGGTADDVMQTLGGLGSEILRSEAHAVTPDGSIVVGKDMGGDATEAFAWSSGDAAITGLGFYNTQGASPISFANAVSADGSVIVGGGLASSSRAFRWHVGLDGLPHTEDDIMHGLGDLEGGSSWSEAFAVSANGSVIVGGSGATEGYRAVIWTEEMGVLIGFQSLEDYLGVNFPQLDLSGWALEEATGISADGLVIVGKGTNPAGNDEGWIVSMVPEPKAFLLQGIAGLTLLVLRSRQGR